MTAKQQFSKLSLNNLNAVAFDKKKSINFLVIELVSDVISLRSRGRRKTITLVAAIGSLSVYE